METEGSSLSLTAGITVMGVGGGRRCFPGSTMGWGWEAGHSSPPSLPFSSPPQQDLSEGVLGVLVQTRKEGTGGDGGGGEELGSPGICGRSLLDIPVSGAPCT